MLKQKNAKQSRIVVYFYFIICFVTFLSCHSEQHTGLNAIPNSFTISHYNEDSKIRRTTRCWDYRLIEETVFLNDTTIKFELVKSDTIMEQDSLGIIEKVNYIYTKKIYVKDNLVYSGVPDSTDIISYCDCENNCR